jgi:hypothetical protein
VEARREGDAEAPENVTTNRTRGAQLEAEVRRQEEVREEAEVKAPVDPSFPCIKIMCSINNMVCPFWLEGPAKMSTVGFYSNSLK